MKKISKLPKKILSLFIAVLMIVSSMPFTAVTASAATANEIYDGLDAEFKSHQVGFFFSDASTDPQYDKISGTNKLSGSGATWDSAEGGFKFNGDNADHLYIKASDILSNVTSETGFTIHFEAKSLSHDWQRYFDFMCSEPLGKGDTYYLCATPKDGGKVCVKHSDGADGYKEMTQISDMNTSDGQWHTYTIAVSNSTVEVWVDGKAFTSQQDGLIDSNWFNTMRDNGYIRFGISAFSSDPAYDGWLKNVHIYDVAYTEPAYLFAYFTGDDDQADAVNQRIRFALSKDGVNFTSINGNNPILKNDQVSGTVTWNNKTGMAHTKGVRDPFIIKKVNEAGYFVVATDLRVGNNGGSYNNSKIVVWDINDLSKADKAIPWVVETSGMFGSTYYSGSTIDSNFIAWAPEITYDYQNNIYMMYWSGPSYYDSTILCAYTHDFKTFYQDPQATKTIDGNTVKPKTLFSESGQNTIDADIVFDGENYYMVYKRESEKQLYFVKASTIDGLSSQTGTRFYDSRFTGANGNKEGLEGPELYKNADNKWTLIADNYTKNTGAGSKGVFEMYQVDSLDEFMTGADCSSKSVNTNINDCSPRHGAVTTISSGVYASLNSMYGGISDAEGSLVARYFTTDNLTEDTSGNNYSATVSSGISYVSKVEGVENCAFFDATTSNTSKTNPIYAKIRTDQMYAKYNFNFADGVTFTWKSYDLLPKGNDGYTGLVSVTEGDKLPAYIGSENTDTYSHYENAYAFVLGGLCNGISSGTVPPSKAECESYGHTEYKNTVLGNKWVDYKMVFTGRGYKVYRNGEVVVNAGVNKIDETWYSDLFSNGTIILGSTFFDNDCNFRGYISDFRIYATGNQESVANLEKEIAIQDREKKIAAAKGNLNKDSADNAQAESFNAKGYYGSNEATDGTGKAYSNILYCSKNISSPSAAINQGFCDWKFLFPSKVVMIYDGVNKVSSPIVLSVVRHDINKSPGYAEINDSDFGSKVELRGNWKGYNTDGSWPYNNTNKTISYTSSKYWAADKLDKTTRYFGNILYYKALGNTDTYYDNVYKLDFHVSNGAGNDGTHSENKYRASFNNYYINYKPIYNILTEADGANVTVKETGKSYKFKELYNEVYPNQWMFTEDSLANYLIAVNKLLNLNIGSMFSDANDSNVDAKVKTSALEIKEAYESYTSAVNNLKKKTINVDFTFADGSVTTKTINAGATLDGIIPANTSAEYNNNKHSHMSYTWSEGCEASHQPQSDEAYFEVFATNECSFVQNTTIQPTCEKDGLADFTCSVCGGKYTDTVPALRHAWSSTYTSNNNGTHRQVCQNDNSHVFDSPCNMVVQSETETETVMACNICGYTVTTAKLNRTAYNNAVDAARNVILKETAKYSADSLKALQAVLNQAATDSLDAKTQDELNEITARIVAANSTDTASGGVLVANTFRITYGNMFDYNEFMNSDSNKMGNESWGKIDFDIANQVFTVIGNGTYDDVYSAYAGAKTYKIPVSDNKSYTFEFTAKGTLLNQAFVFFYDSNGNPIRLDSSYTFTETENGITTDRNASEVTDSYRGDYFVNKYRTPDGGTTKLTFTPPAGTVKVDFRFGLIDGNQSCEFYNIGFYETSKADNFIVADNVEYGTDFGAIAISTPDVDGMHFGGWFVDKECSKSVTTIGTVTENINLYAKLHPYVVKEEVGCTLVNNGYTVYVCSGDCAGSEMTAYDDKLLDGETNGYWNAYNNLVALVTAEESNNYANYTKASVDAVKKAYTDLHTTACASHKQAEVNGYANDMKAIINQLVVKVNFVVKENGGIDKTITQEIPYKGAVDLLGLQVEPYTTVDGRYTWTFSSWDKTIVTANITTGATYIAQYTSVDNALAKLEAYNAAVSDAQNSIKNTAKYTEASRNVLQGLLDSIIIDENSTMAVIDEATAKIITANQLKQDDSDTDRVLALMKYDVEFYYVLDNNPAEKCTTGNATVDYGTEFELTAPSIEGNYSILKWIRKTYPNGKPKEETVGSSNETLKGRYTGKTEYYVYLKTIPAQQESTKTANIYLTDRLGRVIDAMSVTLENGSATVDVSVRDNSITIGNVTMTAPSISFYNVSGFTMNNEAVTDRQYKITDDTYISVTYEPATSFTIEYDATTCTADKTTAQWDDKVTVTAIKGTANTQWYVNGVLVGYGPKYVFRANQDVNITCKNETVELVPTAAVSRLSYNSPIKKTITVVGSFNLPDGYTLVETGVLLKTSAVNNKDAVNNAANYNLESGNAKKFVATNYTKDTHQFTVNVYSSKQYDEIYLGAVAYVTYTYGNETHTTYSPLVNTTYINSEKTQSSISQEVA